MINREGVWVGAVKRISTTYGILQHPPHLLGSLPVHTLRDLALQPHRWQMLLRTTGTQNAAGQLNHVLFPRSASTFKHEDAGGERFHIVPGGRYLVTDDALLKVVALWDLGLSDSKDTQPTRIAQLDVPGSPLLVSLSCWGCSIMVGIICGSTPDMYVPLLRPKLCVELNLILFLGLSYMKLTSPERHHWSSSTLQA